MGKAPAGGRSAGARAADQLCGAVRVLLQADTDVMGRALRFEADSPRQFLIGATDAGYLAYWSRHEVVNLDGIANARAYQAIRAGQLHTYIDSRPFDRVLVDAGRWGYYDRALAAR